MMVANLDADQQVWVQISRLFHCTMFHYLISLCGSSVVIDDKLNVTDWLSDWLSDWLTDRRTDGRTDGRTDRPTDRPYPSVLSMPTDWLTDWLTPYSGTMHACLCAFASASVWIGFHCGQTDIGVTILIPVLGRRIQASLYWPPLWADGYRRHCIDLRCGQTDTGVTVLTSVVGRQIQASLYWPP